MAWSRCRSSAICARSDCANASARPSGALGDAQLGRRFRLEHRGQAAALRDVDDLLLRDAAHGAEAVLGRGKTHDGIERFAEDAAVGADDRKLVHRKTRRRSARPTTARDRRACSTASLQSLLPFALLGRSAQHDAGAAVGAVRFQHQELAVAPRIFEQVAFAVVGQRRAAIADDARPQARGGGTAGGRRR